MFEKIKEFLLFYVFNKFQLILFSIIATMYISFHLLIQVHELSLLFDFLDFLDEKTDSFTKTFHLEILRDSIHYLMQKFIKFNILFIKFLKLKFINFFTVSIIFLLDKGMISLSSLPMILGCLELLWFALSICYMYVLFLIFFYIYTCLFLIVFVYYKIVIKRESL